MESHRELERKRYLAVVPEPYYRPRTRAECIDGPRPCPFVGCRYHLGIEVTFAGSLKFNFSEEELGALKHSCALDVADKGGVSQDDLAPILNVTHERVRQIEVEALAKLRELVDPEDF